MKTGIFYRVMMVALLAVCTIQFTACGGSDDPLENTKPNSQNNQNNGGNNNQGGNEQGDGQNTGGGYGDISTYIWPCMDWGCSLQQVKGYMGTAMEVSLEADNAISYCMNDNEYVVIYTFGGENKLASIVLNYKGQNRMQAVMDEFTKRYGAEWRNEGVYRTYCTINNRECHVQILWVQERDDFQVSIEKRYK